MISAAAPSTEADTGLAIQATGLTKRYGELVAVDGLDLAVPEGTLFGLLGPNGSGKTSTVHMLTTLIRPDGGWARVAQHDVARDPVAVRHQIGLVFQDSALDRNLTVDENLRFAGALYNLPRRLVTERSGELLELFGLSDKRDVKVEALSGGMRRALDIARGVLHRPRVLFLDEPTIGLDVLNRRGIWRFVERLQQHEGMTVLLTTHYLEEAEGCHQVLFLGHGRMIGAGTPRELIDGLAHRILEVETEDSQAVAAELEPRLGDALIEGEKVSFLVRDGTLSLDRLEAELRAPARAVHLRRPGLNDVYVWLNAPGREPQSSHQLGN